MVSDCGGTPTRFGRTNPDWTPPRRYFCEVCGCSKVEKFDECDECDIRAFLTPSEYALYREKAKIMLGKDSHREAGHWFLIPKYIIPNEKGYWKRREKFYATRRAEKFQLS